MTLRAGAAQREITPQTPMFLFGYPHVPRTSTGVHDPLYAAALYLERRGAGVLLISVDVLMLDPETVRRCRDEVHAATGVPPGHILISATHTHSAPVTVDVLAFRDDPVVPPADPGYMERVGRGIRDAAAAAVQSAVPAQVAVTRAYAAGVGGNRHSVDGPSDPEVDLLVIRDAATHGLLALDATYSMHPTVLHEDSTEVSADFPGFARAYLNRQAPGAVLIYHTGPSGNQSPRYYVTGQTPAEAERLGTQLGAAIWDAVTALDDGDYADDVPLHVQQTYVALPPRTYADVPNAENMLEEAVATYRHLEAVAAPHGPLRTAECAVFGAEEAVTLARAQAQGEIAALVARYTPVEVQVIRVGDAFIVGLPGELFVEYGLEIKARAPGAAFVVSLANGELQGYIVTPGATGYEAGISLFLPEAGSLLVERALRMIAALQAVTGDDHP